MPSDGHPGSRLPRMWLRGAVLIPDEGACGNGARAPVLQLTDSMRSRCGASRVWKPHGFGTNLLSSEPTSKVPVIIRTSFGLPRSQLDATCSEALVVEEILPNSAGDRAGIQVGDRVLSIDGRRVEGLGEWDRTRINFEVGKSYRLQVERGAKQFERVMTLQPQSWSKQKQVTHISIALNISSALLSLFVAFLIAFTRPYDWVARIG